MKDAFPQLVDSIVDNVVQFHAIITISRWQLSQNKLQIPSGSWMREVSDGFVVGKSLV